MVVGASLAGLRAVEAARRSRFDGAITLIGAEPYLPYDRPPMSKQFLTAAAEPVYFRTEHSLRSELDVDLRLGTPATALDLAKRTVVADGEEIGYTGLVIATGAMARELPGMPRLTGLYTLRYLDDALAIRDALRPGTRVVIIGAGFIGSEVACSARRIGAEVAVVEAAPVPLVCAVGEQVGAACTRLLERNGIDVRCGVAVASIEGTGGVERVRLCDGSTLPADVVIVGVGVAPATRVTGALGLNHRRPIMRLRAMIGKRATWTEALHFTRSL